ncbi:MAG: hypothetical protein IV086_06035 [Hyphomonadaceae bacterium]|nr:MAG: hypothetical protein FD160_2084 [Caulobacteraceae bacterium]MBT9445239.1 hypothetical protein [Hyphomonadaceae bacterium]TPW07292.1 MAG: hypothetical protein FD124_1247 [Alphaproteobacteria bacterium]
MNEKREFCLSERCHLTRSNSGAGHDTRFDEYFIPMDAHGVVRQQLFFCLWCGAKLPVSHRDEWFDKLEAMGIDPMHQDVPEEFKTDVWRTKKS